jgi:4-amino-4-deoxy-L-arabinose transferase-like glycosyltransferase
MSAEQVATGLDWPAGVLTWLARRPLPTLGLLFLLLWVPGVLSLPPLDRDESRFAQSSRQMLTSGDFVDIRFGHVPRYKKPVGIYWLQAAATEVAGRGDRSHIWTYRLPSLVGGLLSVFLTFWCAAAFASMEVAWLSAALLGASLLLTAESTIATTDAVQLACILGSIGVLLRAYLAGRDPSRAVPSTRLVIAGWAALGAAILVKGPVAPAVSLATIVALVAWEREWRWLKLLRPFLGAPVAVAIVAPWAIAIALTSHGAFYAQSLGQDFAAKLASGQETHGAWPGYYLALLTISFWPAILFLAPALGASVRQQRDPAMRFLLAWAGASWVVFELIPTKLPHYVLPVYPALAILAAVWVLAPRETAAPRWQVTLFYLALIQFLIGLIAVVSAMIELPLHYGAGSTWWLIAAACVAALFGIGALAAQVRALPIFACGLALVTVLVSYPTITAGSAPLLIQLWVSPRAAALERKHSRPGDPPPALAGFTEPSLVFYLGQDARLTNGAGAAEIGAGQGGLALIEDGERQAFLARLADLETDATKLDELSGYNYSRGKPVHITIYRVTATHDITEPPAE